MPYLGRSSNFGVRSVFHYLPSAGDTSVSGADADGKTLAFADGNYIDVYLNGVKLKHDTDYNTNTANTVAGLSATAANDEVTVVVYDAFSLATGFETLGGTFGDDITFTRVKTIIRAINARVIAPDGLPSEIQFSTIPAEILALFFSFMAILGPWKLVKIYEIVVSEREKGQKSSSNEEIM